MKGATYDRYLLAHYLSRHEAGGGGQLTTDQQYQLAAAFIAGRQAKKSGQKKGAGGLKRPGLNLFFILRII